LPRWGYNRLSFCLPERSWPVGTNTIAGLAASVVCCVVVITLFSIALHAQDFSSLAASADAARQQGDTPRAIELYRKATEKNPNWPDGWWFLGILQYNQNQYDPARDALTHYLQLTPKAAPALALRGICEFNTGADEPALQDLERADALGAANQPRNAQILYYHEGLLLTHFARFEEALTKFQLLVQQGADSPDLALAVGLAGLHQNLFPQAVPPDQIPLLSAIGRAAILLMQKNSDASRQAFQSLFNRYPQLPNIHYLYGYLLFPTNPDAALAQFHQELAISPQNASAHAMLAWALELQGDYAASLDDAAKAATDDPSLPMAQLVYGKALVETGDLQAGLLHLERALAAEPGNLEAHLAMVKAYSKLGRSEDARRERLLCLSISQQGAVPVAAP
jgi:tetratricopeptide (TPR) repeat protein